MSKETYQHWHTKIILGGFISSPIVVNEANYGDFVLSRGTRYAYVRARVHTHTYLNTRTHTHSLFCVRIHVWTDLTNETRHTHTHTYTYTHTHAVTRR